MTQAVNTLLNDLKSRGLVNQMSSAGDISTHLKSPRVLYCGFDPTADSLHIGSLVPLLALRRFQLAGHKPIALVGGATALVGDPSFKTAERQLINPDIIQARVTSIKAQICHFLDFSKGRCQALLANNADWTSDLRLLAFLRDVGKHFSVNAMIKKESVKQRIDHNDFGISFTEFSYSLLQAYDFVELRRRFSCSLQLGGSDQWGNLVSGIELNRRMNNCQVFAMTLPLVTKSDGSKFGKTETGNLWLDPQKTSPYRFYQFWLNTSDADVERFLNYFTFLDGEAISDLVKSACRPREAQLFLAQEITRVVHGQDVLAAAERITKILFESTFDELSVEDFKQLSLDGMETTQLSKVDLAAKSLTGLLTEVGMVSSGKQVKDALLRGAVSVNGQKISNTENINLGAIFAPQNGLQGRFYIVKIGKKKHHLFVLKHY